MGAPAFLPAAWFVLIGLLLCGYSILDGFDLGLGTLLPFLARDEKQKEEMFRSIGPVWDGNEVWLLAAGGALFAAFPQAYATVFSGFYLALMLVLFALILRAVAIEFRSHVRTGKRFWEAAFVAGSALPSLFFGIALGNVVMGVPLDSRMEYTGSLVTLLRPLPLVFGFLGLAVFILQGCCWAALKTSGKLRQRARRTALVIDAACGALFLISFVAVWGYLPQALRRPWAWLSAAGVTASLVLVRAAVKKKKDGLAWLLSSAACLGLWGIVGAIHYPNLVRASDPAMSLTIFNASSSPLTLKVMLVIALVGMPIVVGYTLFAYRVFRGKVRADEEGY